MTTATFGGNQGTLYVKKESEFGTPVAPVAGDGIRYTQFNPVLAPNLIDNPEAGAGRTRQKPAQGRLSSTWNLSTALRPASAAGQAPEIGDLLELAMGANPTSNQGGVTYALTTAQEKSMTLWYDEPLAQEAWTGCVIQNMTFRWDGTGLTAVDFSGVGRDVRRFVPFVAADPSGTDLPPPMGIDARDLAGVGNILNGGSVVTDVSATSISLSTAISGSGNVDIISGLPPAVYGSQGEIHYGTQGSVILNDGTEMTVRVLNGQMQLNTGVSLLDNEFGEATPRAVISPAQRQLNLSLTMNVQRNEFIRSGRIDRYQDFGAIIVIGPPSDGRRFQLAMPRVTFQSSSPQRANNAISTITIQGQATAATENAELVLTTM